MIDKMKYVGEFGQWLKRILIKLLMVAIVATVGILLKTSNSKPYNTLLMFYLK